ncbi:AP2/ERF and B3 domain-containing transcription factor At1g51120-like [Primulina huaijiensis]|uniref:AP2/ERF and B3 domain-containing transcription factor At1g51120-like n=1 Tax=Primulina huaijiensis TaxID=1492673 RepID=UPI003CC6E191
MEEPGVVSGIATTTQSEEVFPSNTSNKQIPFKNLERNVSASTSRFKGVVSQQNGHWGTQIYANHARIWLGTFKSEQEAAMAYDSAAIKLRNGDSYRNFPWTDITIHEPSFQSQFNTESVLGMIKDGSYPAKFSEYLRAQAQCGNNNQAILNGVTGVKVRQLFKKELTPSDVSKLNRLVIPKKYAVKYFPQISEMEEENGGGIEDIELAFFDRSMRSWKFRYCYWKSSQSFVFTRGWNRFAKEKGLRSKDTVIFSIFEINNGLTGVQRLSMIDVAYNEGHYNDGEAIPKENEKFDSADGSIEDEDNTKVGEDHHAHDSPEKVKKKGFKLFGVQII